jgi:hypothetical protein
MNCRGQALAEFAVAAGVLAMLLLGMPVICRYHELQVATIEGARRQAFESSWQQAHGARAGSETIRHDLFAQTGDAGQVVAARIDASDRQDPAPGLAGQAVRVLLAPFRAVALVQSGFDLRTPLLYRGDLAVTLSRPTELPQPFDEIPIELREHYALLGDDWASSGPGQVAERAGGLVVTRSLRSLHALTALGTQLLSIIEPAFRDFCPGQVDPERVPSDRLGTGIDHDSGPVSRWSPSC